MEKNESKGYKLIILAGLVIVVIGWYFAKTYYYTANVKSEKAVFFSTAHEFAEIANINPNKIKNLISQYVELEGVVTNVIHSDGEDLIVFTSGIQTDSSFEVGMPVIWEDFLTKNAETPCDSLIFNYGKIYRLKASKLPIIFKGDAINGLDTVANIKYYNKCHTQSGLKSNYFLENFCLEKIKVKAKLEAIKTTEKGIEVQLSNILILEKTPLNKTAF